MTLVSHFMKGVGYEPLKIEGLVRLLSGRFRVTPDETEQEKLGAIKELKNNAPVIAPVSTPQFIRFPFIVADTTNEDSRSHLREFDTADLSFLHKGGPWGIYWIGFIQFKQNQNADYQLVNTRGLNTSGPGLRIGVRTITNNIRILCQIHDKDGTQILNIGTASTAGTINYDGVDLYSLINTGNGNSNNFKWWVNEVQKYNNTVTASESEEEPLDTWYLSTISSISAAFNISNGLLLVCDWSGKSEAEVLALDAQVKEILGRERDRIESFSRDYLYIPTEFTSKGFNARIWKDRLGEWHTDYDFEELKDSITGTTGYVDVNAADGGDGTVSTPYNDLNEALADATYNIYMIAPGRYKKDKGWRGGNFNKPIALICSDPEDYAEVTTQVDVTWSLDSGDVYVASNPDSDALASVQDLAEIDENGVPVGYFAETSKAGVAAREGSFWYDSAEDEIFIHCIGGRTPDSDICVFAITQNLDTNLNGNVPLYCERIRFFGGRNRIRNNATIPARKIGFVDCWFSYSGVKDGFDTQNGHKIEGFLKDCRADYNRGDGFNYNQDDTGVIFEWNCQSWFTTRQTNSDNGSTAHNASHIIRVLGNYQYQSGKAVQDIVNSRTLTVACFVDNSTALDDLHKASYASNSSSGETIMWLIECVTGEDAAINRFWNFDGSIMRIFDGEVGNLLEGNNRQDAGSVLEELEENQVFFKSQRYG